MSSTSPALHLSTILPGHDAATPLRAEGLSKRYGRQTVLQNLSLQLEPGTVLGLIGRNGAGKSTLLQLLLGLAEPDAGQATVFGQPALRMGDAVKQRLGYVPQQPMAFQWMTPRQLLRFLAQVYDGWDQAHAEALLARWDIRADKVLAKLSPGETQRLAIVRALAPRPALLVLDEPAAALDPVARRQLLREIVAHAGEEGGSVLFSTHIVSDLERVASHVAFLHEGRLLLHTDIDAAKETIARVHVPAAGVAALPERLPGELARRALGDGGIALVLMDDGHTSAQLAQRPGVQCEPLGLEDLFVEIAG
ncbi:ABC-2 type transport system ATP-binding protein [Pseudoxanthomonas sp. GM95]|uniref:ABC transporter ATP-binding protein n=1 Tax=Pseudoxanthomonas sp. GM95 TaxID=1881043 RepID=UPI0008C3EEE3|nr:ABC transporter ATP-binding protein [Pseudoxanthomonas sp. GM95]SEM24479.1 ABC-2 type transport system ATP-binding protein [Pseudoxanthomonas sp. GM95]